jgi:hypothetical protein
MQWLDNTNFLGMPYKMRSTKQLLLQPFETHHFLKLFNYDNCNYRCVIYL